MARRPAKPIPPHPPATRPLGTVSGRPRAIRRRPVLIAAGIAAAVAALAWAVVGPEEPARLRARAEAAALAGDWDAALEAWKDLNRTDSADARTHLGEARALLVLGRAAQAQRALGRATAARPADPVPWRLRLELLRVEGRPLDALKLGWAAYDAVPPGARRDVLRTLTLALMADPPEDLARRTLGRWVAADPDDLDAQVALLGRIAAQVRPDDPDRGARIATLTGLLARAPGHVAAREALVVALADAGETDRGRAVLDAWPEPLRDARYDRLRGRWDLEFDHQPAPAVATLRRALAVLPHDATTRYRLARALQTLGRRDEARREAQAVALLRELLEPIPLGRRLEADLAHRDDPASCLDLADLCARAGLMRLADAWRREGSDPPRKHGAHGGGQGGEEDEKSTKPHDGRLQHGRRPRPRGLRAPSRRQRPDRRERRDRGHRRQDRRQAHLQRKRRQEGRAGRRPLHAQDQGGGGPRLPGQGPGRRRRWPAGGPGRSCSSGRRATMPMTTTAAARTGGRPGGDPAGPDPAIGRARRPIARPNSPRSCGEISPKGGLK